MELTAIHHLPTSLNGGEAHAEHERAVAAKETELHLRHRRSTLGERVRQDSRPSATGWRLTYARELECPAGLPPGVLAGLGTGTRSALMTERDLRSGHRVLPPDEDLAVVRDRVRAALGEVEDPSPLELGWALDRRRVLAGERARECRRRQRQRDNDRGSNCESLHSLLFPDQLAESQREHQGTSKPATMPIATWSIPCSSGRKQPRT